MTKYSKGDYTNCRCNICEIVDEDDKIVCNVVTEDFEKVIGILEENEQLKHDATVLICSNQEYRGENEKLKKMYYDILKLLKMELVEE